jgi:hypothetical protein
MQAKRYSPKSSGDGIPGGVFGALTEGSGAMPTTATISKDQRDGIYELVRNHLGGIGDVWIALEQDEDFATAERLSLEFGEDFRLLADIGWRPGDDRVEFELTMPPHDLTELLKRLHDEAETLLVESPGERRSREEDEETDRRFQTGLDACEEVLIEVDERGGERA